MVNHWTERLDHYIRDSEDNFLIGFGPIRCMFAWDEKFREIGSALKKWLRETDRDMNHLHMAFLISQSLFEEITEKGEPSFIYRTWAWEAILISSNENLRIWVCKPCMPMKKWVAKMLPTFLMRFLNSLGASYWELQAGYFLYHFIINELENVLIANSCSLVHAAAFSDSLGTGILVCGSGGIGKTTTAAHFVSERSWKIIADDFVVLSKEGEAYDSHLPAHLYGYHSLILNQLGLKENVFFNNWIDKLHWKIYNLFGVSKVVRRVALPKTIKLLHDRIKFCFIVEIVDNNNTEYSIELISPFEAAIAASEYTIAELLNSKVFFKTDEDFINNKGVIVKVLNEALLDVSCYKLKIPLNKTGYELANLILEQVDVIQSFV